MIKYLLKIWPITSSLKLGLLIGFTSLGGTPIVWAGPTETSAVSITESELSQAVTDRIKRVHELEFIRQEAEKMGVHAYLFGDAASGFGHYVKWDLLREKGDSRYQPDRFDYDYTNIYRSGQDFDIVLDGNAEQAGKLQNLLHEKYPQRQGPQSTWEVRLLRNTLGDKEALLGNPDFLNRHSDSNSTGLIELTQPKAGENAIKDLKAWDSKIPLFFKDIQEGTLHYDYSPLHKTTLRYKSGLDPDIFSVIRYLTKAFQYELKIEPQDLAKIKEVIAQFNPSTDLTSNYTKEWIEKNGKKLFQNAMNIEYAWDTLESLGLRKKLIGIKNNFTEQDSLAWWLSKEPLRTKKLGEGTGRTAAEIAKALGKNELDVTHHTNNVLSYESINSAPTGSLNAFISRANEVKEAAVFGDGFYTYVGNERGNGSGLSIHLVVDPKAREGTDFVFQEVPSYIIVKNKAAIHIIPESLKIGPVEYFRKLIHWQSLDELDRESLKKLKLRISNNSTALSPTEKAEIWKIVQENPDNKVLRNEWFALPISVEHPELVESMLKKGDEDREISTYVLSQPHWSKHPEFVESLLNKGSDDREIVANVLSLPHWSTHPEWVEKFLKKGTVDSEIAHYVLSRPHWSNHPEWIENLLKKGTVDSEIAQYVLSQPHWSNHPEWVKSLLAKGTTDAAIAGSVLSRSHWSNHPEWVEGLLKKGTVDSIIVQQVLSQPHGVDHPEWVESLIQKGTVDQGIAEKVLSQPYWSNHPELVESLIRKGTEDFSIASFVLTRPQWSNHPELVESLIKKGSVDREIAKKVLGQPHWSNHPELVESLIQKGTQDSSIATFVLTQPQWSGHPELVESLLKKGTVDQDIAKYILTQPQWSDRLDWLELLLKRSEKNQDLSEALRGEVLTQDTWLNQPVLKAACKGHTPTLQCLQRAIQSGFDFHAKLPEAGQKCAGFFENIIELCLRTKDQCF